MTLNLKRLSLRLTIEGELENQLDLSSPIDNFKKVYSLNFTNGAGANQAHYWWHDTRTLAGGGSENLDFAGSLTDSVSGGAFTPARIKAIIIIHKTAAASAALSVGGHATAALATLFTSADTLANDQPAFNVRPGGWLPLVAPDATGYVVTATTADLLKVLNNAAGSVDYDIFVLAATT